MYPKDDRDQHGPVCYELCVALWDWLDSGLLKTNHYNSEHVYTWQCMCSDNHFEHALRLTFKPFLLYVWDVFAMGAIWLNNI